MAGVIVCSLVFAACGGGGGSSSGGDGGASAGSDAPAPDGAVASAMQPQLNGWAFPNFPSATFPDINFDTSDLVSMFGGGPEVCVDGIAEPCTLTAEAAAWARMVNQARATGHCEGLVALASARFNKAELPETVKLPSQEEEIRALMRAFATQFVPEVQAAISKWTKASLADKVDELKKSFASDKLEYTLGVYVESGGHAILPYAVEYPTPDIARIMVYDSNWPGRNRYVDVDLKAETWSFSFAGDDPANDPNIWTGGAGDMDLTPFEAREGTCPFCGDDTKVQSTTMLVRTDNLDWSVQTPGGTVSPTESSSSDGTAARPVKGGVTITRLAPRATDRSSYDFMITIPNDVLENGATSSPVTGAQTPGLPSSRLDAFVSDGQGPAAVGPTTTVPGPTTTVAASGGSRAKLLFGGAASVFAVTPGGVAQFSTPGSKDKPVEVGARSIKSNDPNVDLTMAAGNLVANASGPTAELGSSEEGSLAVQVTTSSGEVIQQEVTPDAPAVQIKADATGGVTVLEATASGEVQKTEIAADGTKTETVVDASALNLNKVEVELPPALASKAIEALPKIEDRNLNNPNYKADEAYVAPTTTVPSAAGAKEVASGPTTTVAKSETPSTVQTRNAALPGSSTTMTAAPRPGSGPTTTTARSVTAAGATPTTVVAVAKPTLSNFRIATKTFGDDAFTLDPPDSNSPGGFRYASSKTDVATVNATTGRVTIVGAGSTVITATQAAARGFEAGTITATLIVAKATPQNSALKDITKTFGDDSFIIAKPTTDSTGAFTFTSSNEDVVKQSKTTGRWVITGAGKATITVSQASTDDFLSSTDSFVVTVRKGTPELKAPTDVSKAFLDADFDLPRPTSDSKGAFTYTSSDANIVSVTGAKASIKSAGTVTITASQAGTDDWVAASTTYKIVVAPTAPTLSEFADVSKTFGDDAFTLTAPKSNSTGAFTFKSSDDKVVTVGEKDGKVTIIGAGSATITASQAATSGFSTGSISSKVTVAKASPTVSDLLISDKAFGDADFTLKPTSTSSGKFTFSTDKTTVFDVDADTGLVKIVGLGTATLTAKVASTANYEAGSASASVTVKKGVPTITWTLDNKTFGDADFDVARPTTNSGGSLSYSVSTADSVTATVSSTGRVSIKRAGVVTVNVKQAATALWEEGAATATLTIDKVPVVLTGFSVPSRETGSPAFVITPPTSSSPDSPTFTYAIVGGNSSIASINGATLTPGDVGTVTVRVTQAATLNYASASATTNFVVTKRSQVAGLTNGRVGYWTFDDANALGANLQGTGNLDSVGSPTWSASGKFGGAVSLNGSGAYLAKTTGSITGLPIGNSSYTIAAWIKPTAFGQRGIAGWGNYWVGNQNNAFRLDSGGGLVNYWWGNDLVTGSRPNEISIGGPWAHVAATYDGVTRRIWVNGAVAASDTNRGPVNVTGNDFTIGKTVGDEWFAGLLDDVTIYDRSLSSSEIASLMAAPGGGFGVTSVSGTFGTPLTLATTGGLGTGAVTYQLVSAGTAGCSITNAGAGVWTLSATSAGTCLVRATKAGDANYLAATSPDATISIDSQRINPNLTGFGTDSGSGPGLKGTRYEGYFNDDVTWFATATKNGETNQITDFTYFSSNSELYSWEWIGAFKASTSGSYEFCTSSDDASYLWLGETARAGFTRENALVDSGGLHGMWGRCGTITLSGGSTYPIRIQFGENGGGDAIIVSFRLPDGTVMYDGAGYYFAGLGITKTDDVTSFTPTLPTSVSPAPIVYASSNTAVATINPTTGLVTIVGRGTTTLTASQAAIGNFDSAVTSTDLRVLRKPTIGTFTLPTGLTAFSEPFTPTPPTSNSPGSWSYESSNPDVAKWDASTNKITTSSAGTTTITAVQGEGGGFAEGRATATITIDGASIVSIDAGQVHTCGVTSTGGVSCWGYNGEGQLGDGTTSNRSYPTAVSGITSGAAVVAAGSRHTCVAMTTGTVKCWGRNDSGQLGNNTQTNSLTPVTVSGISNAVDLALSGYASCAILSTGSVSCWGSNSYGMLGNGLGVNSPVPVPVLGGTGATTNNANENAFCVTTSSGSAFCWGWNGYAQLGDGSRVDRALPTEVVGLTSGAISIAMGEYNSCAVTGAGGVSCWGLGDYGQNGDGTNAFVTAPVPVNGLTSGFKSVAMGERFTCAVSREGMLKCWGRNDWGNLGDGSNQWRNTPITPSSMDENVRQVTAGWYHACAVMATGTLRCWGHNDEFELGDKTNVRRMRPVGVATVKAPVVTTQDTTIGTLSMPVNKFRLGMAPFTFDAVSTNRPAAVTYTSTNPSVAVLNASTRTVTVVGVGTAYIRASIPATSTQSAAVSLARIEVSDIEITSIRTGYHNSCAISRTSEVLCWGNNDWGQLGDGTNAGTAVAKRALGVGSVADVATGHHHTCAVTTLGGVKCWGYGGNGQLGNGSNANSSVPVMVTGLSSGVAQVDAGYQHTCALTTGGGVKCWGYNGRGQLGDGSTDNRAVPVDVAGLTSGVVAIDLGWEHSCALLATGAVKCWGYNGHGEVGDNSTTDRDTPRQVSGLTSGVKAISSGFYHSCALTSTGGVTCWGYNGYGQLGDQTNSDRTTPANVYGLSSGVTQIEAGAYHSCGLTSTGGVKCWGRNDNGELGDGTRDRRAQPVNVTGLASGVTSISMDNSQMSCAIIANDSVKCWGHNEWNQSGTAIGGDRITPTDVFGVLAGPVRTATTIGSISLPGSNYTSSSAPFTLALPTSNRVNGTTCANGGLCDIGDIGPGGGRVFFASGRFNAPGTPCLIDCTYLEAAPADWAGGQDPNVQWSGVTDTAVGASARSSAIGGGLANSTAALAQSATSGRAISMARTYAGGGKTDWYLPSTDEMVALSTARDYVDGLRCNDWYATSTELNDSVYWVVYPCHSSTGHSYKAEGRYVRPIRAFKAAVSSVPIRFASTNSSVATVDRVTGLVTITGAGRTVLSAYQGGTGESVSGASRVVLNVRTSCADGGTCSVGEVGPGGGVVFFDAGSNQWWGRYLEAAGANLAAGPWCTASMMAPLSATSESMGAGAANTATLESGCSAGVVRAAADLVAGGKSDWYLPSSTELVTLYSQRSVVTGLGSTSLWSSTRDALGNVSVVNFADGSTAVDSGSSNFAARPIRAFATGLTDCQRAITCQIGDTGPGGGTVFWVDSNDTAPGIDYLEVGPTDLSAAWCSDASTSLSGADDNDRGIVNMQAHLANCASGIGASARAYNGGGKTDWYAPSPAELVSIRDNLVVPGLASFGSAPLWTSRQQNATTAYAYATTTGAQSFPLKSQVLSFRPIRAIAGRDSGTVNASLSGFAVQNPTLFGSAAIAVTPPTSRNPGVIRYTSSNPAIAAIDQYSGKVTTLGVGSTTLTATKESFGGYLEKTQSIGLTVSKGNHDLVGFTPPGGPYRADDGTLTMNRPTSNATCAKGGVCAIGDIGPGGGKVFFDAGSNQSWGRYLEAAPTDFEAMPWCNAPIPTVTGAGLSAIGTGASNTTAADAQCTTGAVQAAADYANLGTTDWYLPSVDELLEMYAKRATIGGFGATSYWASTQEGNGAVKRVGFADGGMSGHDGLQSFRVRPIRAFVPDLGTVTFASNNSNIATIDANSGLVTIKAAGSVTLTATMSTSTKWNSSSVEYALSISKLCKDGGFCRVGDEGPGGGTIFFVDSSNSYPTLDYLELAPADTVTPTAWCTGSTNPTTATALGTGQANTTAMLAASPACAAASAADAYATAAATDWFLPSKAELEAAVTNLATKGIALPTGNYWTSSGSTNGPLVANARENFVSGPTAQSSSNTWQYFEVPADRASATLLSNWQTTGNEVIANQPQWDNNRTSNNYPFVQNITSPPGASVMTGASLLIHPDDSGYGVGVAWKNTTGASIVVDVAAGLKLAYPSGNSDGIDYWVQRGLVGETNFSLLGSGSIATGSTSTASTSAQSVTLAAGESIYVIVGRKSSYVWDHTILDFSVTRSMPRATAVDASAVATSVFNTDSLKVRAIRSFLRLGLTESSPASSASELATYGYPSGNYWIKPNGYSGAARQVWVDMDKPGGPWVLIGKGRQSNDVNGGWFGTDNELAVSGLLQENAAAAGISKLSGTFVNYLMNGTANGWNNSNANNFILVNRINNATDGYGGTGDSFTFKVKNSTRFTWVGQIGSANGGISPNATGAITRYAQTWMTNQTHTTANTSMWDEYFGCNCETRTFTWQWGGHGSYHGWSAGWSISQGFMNGGEGHAIQFAQVWVKN